MTVLTCLLFVFLTFGDLWAQDPLKTDSDKYSIVLENERVRVLEYHDNPGDKTTMHDTRTLSWWRAVLLNGN